MLGPQSILWELNYFLMQTFSFVFGWRIFWLLIDHVSVNTSRELKEPQGRRQQERHKSAYLTIIYNYPPKGRLVVVDIYRDTKRRGIYPPLFTDPEVDSCFSIYQIWWIKKCCFQFFFWNFRETTRHFSFRSQNSD